MERIEHNDLESLLCIYSWSLLMSWYQFSADRPYHFVVSCDSFYAPYYFGYGYEIWSLNHTTARNLRSQINLLVGGL